MASGGKYRGARRRAVLAGAVSMAVGTTGCLSSVEHALGGGYDAVDIDVRASGIVWSGTVRFEHDDGVQVMIPVDRALGSQSYALPDDIDADDYDVIYAPISVEVVPERGIDDANPLAVLVTCDGERRGRASTTTADEMVRIEVS